MKKIAKITAVLLTASLCFSHYSVGDKQTVVAEEAVGVTAYSFIYRQDRVDGLFSSWALTDTETGLDRALLYDKKNCYWLCTVTDDPDMPSLEDINKILVKDSNTGATHLVYYDDKVVPCDKPERLIGNDGGLGVTSAALGDLDNDGFYEIYFTYSWDSGSYCSQVGYFDTKTSDVHYFGDYMCPDSELVLTAENGVLTVCKAELTGYTDKVHIELEANDSIAEIVCKDDEIGIESISDDFVKLPEKLVPTEKPIPEWLPKSADEADAFIDEAPGLTNKKIFTKDGYICCIVRELGISSFGLEWINHSDDSDVKACVSYKRYEDEYWDEYIVACFEMPPDSFLEIWYGDYFIYNGVCVRKPEILYTCVSDENGNITEVSRGDVNKDGEVSVSDVVSLQRWLLGKDDTLGCWQLANINNDDQINAFDLVMLRKLLVEKE